MLIRILIPALLLVLGATASASAQVSPGPFTEVPTGHPLYAVAHYLEQRGIFTGYPEGTFSGRKTLTLQLPPRAPGEKPWWDEHYTDAVKKRDRALFS